MAAPRGGGGGGGKCPPMIFVFFFPRFFFFFLLLLVSSAVGHGHDSTPTPLWFFLEFFWSRKQKCVDFWQLCPPPPPSKHPGVALGNGLYITVITIEKPISVDWNFHWTIYYLMYVFFSWSIGRVWDIAMTFFFFFLHIGLCNYESRLHFSPTFPSLCLCCLTVCSLKMKIILWHDKVKLSIRRLQWTIKSLEWGMFCLSALSSLEMLSPALTARMSQICNECLYSSHTLICM